MSEQINIQWFPGHMTKARRMISANISLVDAICEIVDARIPVSSRNPDLDEMTGGIPRLIVLNRSDQADPDSTQLWSSRLRGRSTKTLITDCRSGKGVSKLSSVLRELLAEKLESYALKGQSGRQIRAMVVGIPNVGKSSFINRAAGRKAAAVSDKPGVTRGRQWIKVDAGLELLDTPGVLWPKFESQTVAENLAFTGAIRDEVTDIETLGANLMLRMKELYPEQIRQRYRLSFDDDTGGFDMLEQAAKNRGFLISGGEYDINRMAVILLDEFRGGVLGRITLER